MEISNWPMFSMLSSEFLNRIRMAYIFGKTGNDAMIVTNEDEVFGMGVSNLECLGIKGSELSLEPIRIPSLCGKNIKRFAFGISNFALAYTEAGELYYWGIDCEVMDGPMEPPHLIPFFSKEKKVVDVACGSNHCVALCENGEVYKWGVHSSLPNPAGPYKVGGDLRGKIISSISCTRTSSVALLENGEVYTWGCNHDGRLGIGVTEEKLFYPSKVQCLWNIKKIVCGESHTLALSDQGILFGWGCNAQGQLAQRDEINYIDPIKILCNVGRIIDIAASHYSEISAAMTENFKVYMWGKCKGQVIWEPYLTPFKSLHEVFLNFSTPSVTYEPLRCTTLNSVRETIKRAFNDSTNSDLTIMVENKPIYVHKCILKLRCDYFKSMFQNHWQENKQNVIEMNRKYNIYKAFLKYLYTDEIDLSLEEALELLELATECCVDSLCYRCEQIIKHAITVENAAMLYGRAAALQAKELEEYCLLFATNHMTAVVQSPGFLELNDTDMKKLILKASKRGIFKS